MDSMPATGESIPAHWRAVGVTGGNPVFFRRLDDVARDLAQGEWWGDQGPSGDPRAMTALGFLALAREFWGDLAAAVRAGDVDGLLTAAAMRCAAALVLARAATLEGDGGLQEHWAVVLGWAAAARLGSVLRLLSRMGELHHRKSLDYGTGQDPLANLRASGELGVPPWVGCLVRCRDKLSRIESLLAKGEEQRAVRDESLEDTMLDMANYLLLAVVLRDEG